jgi:hypothetical protein
LLALEREFLYVLERFAVVKEPRVERRDETAGRKIEATNVQRVSTRIRAGFDPVPRRVPQENTTTTATAATGTGRAYGIVEREPGGHR